MLKLLEKFISNSIWPNSSTTLVFIQSIISMAQKARLKNMQMHDTNKFAQTLKWRTHVKIRSSGLSKLGYSFIGLLNLLHDSYFRIT